MKVVITGGAGFIGRHLAARLLARGRLTGRSGAPEPIDELLLFDAAPPPAAWTPPADARFLAGDIGARDQVDALIDRDDIAVFHLASVVSAGAEQDFDLALRVNLEGARHLLEACRRRAAQGQFRKPPRLVFASSVAAFGGPGMPERCDDLTKLLPQTTYGMTKAIGELLLNDYTRKGFIDGRAARLPTVIVRPGRPNKAASSFVSGIIREPLNGEACLLPVPLEVRMPVLGHRAAAEGLIRLHEAPGEAIGPDRALNFPSLSVSLADMLAALRRVAQGRALGPVELVPDPAIERIVEGWPSETGWSRAKALGLECDRGIDAIIQAYIEDFLAAA
jgi:nucleoside-diphosphate-sugar epimerase